MRMKVFNASDSRNEDEYIEGLIGQPQSLPGNEGGMSFRLLPNNDQNPQLWVELDAREVKAIYDFITAHPVVQTASHFKP